MAPVVPIRHNAAYLPYRANQITHWLPPGACADFTVYLPSPYKATVLREISSRAPLWS
jgi:hypothetical protein